MPVLLVYCQWEFKYETAWICETRTFDWLRLEKVVGHGLDTLETRQRRRFNLANDLCLVLDNDPPLKARVCIFEEDGLLTHGPAYVHEQRHRGVCVVAVKDFLAKINKVKPVGHTIPQRRHGLIYLS